MGFSGSGLVVTLCPRTSGSVSRKQAPLPGFAPGFQAALVQAGVLDADGQAETGAARAPHPRRVRAPEPAEHQLLLTRPQTHTVVAHGHRDGVVVDGHPDPHRLALGVVDRVGDQVAQDALDAAGVDLGDDVLAGHVHHQLDAGVVGQVPDVVQRALHRRTQIDSHSTDNSATPAS